MDEDLKRLLEAMRQENAAAHEQTRQHVDTSVQAVRQENAAAHEQTRQHVDTSVQAVRQENAAAHEQTRQHVDTSIQAVRQENAAAHVETRRHVDVVADKMRDTIQLLAENVAHLDERLTREAVDIREEMRLGFADTQAMIRFSHAELDRRVRSLEDTVSDLQSRVERLEGSTH